MAEVLCLGDSCADIIIPYGEERNGKDVSVFFECGGACANSACSLGKLNVDTSFLGKAGKDLYGLKMKEEFEKAGVDTSLFLIDEDSVSTQILIVIDESGDRHPFLMPKKDPSYLQLTKKDLHLPEDTRYILTNGMMLFQQPAAEAVADFLEEAHEKGVRTLLDINYRVETRNQDRTYLDRVVKISDYLLGSIEDDLLPLAGSENLEGALNKLLIGDRCVVAHDANGATAYLKKEKYHCDSYPVKVADTIGAGDSFNAGFIYGLVHGQKLNDCVRCGCAEAALCVSQKGSRNTPHEEQLLEFIEKHER